MLIAAITLLLRKKYDQYKIYIHNFSHFDSVFMIKVLSNMNLTRSPIIRDGKIINLKLLEINTQLILEILIYCYLVRSVN